MTLHRRSGIWMIAMAALAGCSKPGPPLAQVSGVVTLDGRPLEGAALVFSPKTDVADAGNSWGITDQQGRYTLSFGRKRQGAYLGPHHVVIEHPSRTNRDLSATVGESKNEIDFKLERPKKSEKREPADVRDTAIDRPITAP